MSKINNKSAKKPHNFIKFTINKINIANHFSTGLIGSYCFHCKKLILAYGVVPMILLILASTYGVILAKTLRVLSDCSSWATFLAPIKAVDVCLNLMHHAKATSVSVDSSYFSQYSLSCFNAVMVFYESKGV